MIPTSVVSFLARIYYAWVKGREKQIGYALKINAPASHWIPGTMIFDMTPVWKRFALRARGVNYFTIGAVKNGLSSRYDASSPYYQSWLGGYIIQFPDAREWTLDDHFALGVADQRNWLQMYGVKNPIVEVEHGSTKFRGRISVSGHQGKLYEGNIWSNTDVGDTKPFFLPAMIVGMAKMYKIDNPKLNLSAANFIPQWTDSHSLNPFQKILLKGYFAIIPLTPHTTAMLYANVCEFTDKFGKPHDTFETLSNELRTLLEKMEIVKLF